MASHAADVGAIGGKAILAAAAHCRITRIRSHIRALLHASTRPTSAAAHAAGACLTVARLSDFGYSGGYALESGHDALDLLRLSIMHFRTPDRIHWGRRQNALCDFLQHHG